MPNENSPGFVVHNSSRSKEVLPSDSSEFNKHVLSRPNKPWMILSREERRLIEKIEECGTPLKEWDISIYYGIKTGLNDAFIIDNATKEALICEDPKSAEIIKPVLKGEDIQRFQAHWNGRWLITTHNGYRDIERVDIDEYPAIKKHLDVFWERLSSRQDRGTTPYNLRNCAYHEVFTGKKIFWMPMSENGRFSYSDSEMYCVNSAYLMSGRYLEVVCAILNSRLITWYKQKFAPSTGMGLTVWLKYVVEDLPLPEFDTSTQDEIVKITDEIFSEKTNTNVNVLKTQLDDRVYSLYRLTREEIKLVEQQS